MKVKKALVVVDYQYDFVNGSLGFKGAEKLEGIIVSLIEKADEEGREVLFTKDLHDEDYLNSEEGRNLPIPHCIKGTHGAEIYGKVGELAKNRKIFEKPTFPGASLFDYLRQNDYEEIALCGLDTSICVLSNCIMAKAACPNAHIVLYRFASGSGDIEAEEIAIKALKRVQVEVIDNPV